MCALDIPYTFIPGTKAKANEVNANFNATKAFVDQNEVNIAQNTLDIQNLENTKAELNGAIEQRFQVADPSGDYDAVNKQWFNANTANTKDVIKGFKLTKQSDTSISASPGSCWDSTYEYMITSSSALTEDQANLGQNATYYVYVCADKETTNNELIFSLSNATPELPSGFEYFRLLGNFTTDSSGNISTVNTVGAVDLSGRTGFIGGTYGGQITANNTYTAQENHWVYAQCGFQEKWQTTLTITVGGVRVANMQSGWKYGAGESAIFPVKKGQSVGITFNNRNPQSYVQKYYMV